MQIKRPGDLYTARLIQEKQPLSAKRPGNGANPSGQKPRLESQTSDNNPQTEISTSSEMVHATLFPVASHTHTLPFSPGGRCCAMQREGWSCWWWSWWWWWGASLSGLEAIPICGLNTRPNHRALVSPAISSNLATLDWILRTGPSVP